jgi:hypothetical protein
MAYITTANANSIIYKTDIKSLDLKGSVYKTPIYFFNKLEINRLLVLKELLSDSERFLSEYYTPIKVKDTLNYVYEGKAPAYHKSSNCQRLNSDYENFKIPDSIKEAGIAEVVKFRKWFKENKYLISKPDVFVARLQMRWGIVTNPENINKENSGFTQFDDYTPIEVEEKIDDLIKLAGNLYRKNTAILKKYNKYSYLGERNEPLEDNDTGFPDSKVKAVLREFEKEIKKPLKPLLTAYYRITLNPDLNLHENVLKQLGFTPCSHCYGERELTEGGIKKTDANLPDTFLETFTMIQEGKSIEEISTLRELTTETIIKHIIKIAEIYGTKKLLSVRPNQNIISKVNNAIVRIGSREKLRPIFDTLNEEIPYNDIRLSLLFID